MHKSQLTEAILSIVKNPDYDEDEIIKAVHDFKTKSNEISFHHIIQTASVVCRVTVHDVLSGGRKRDCVRARVIVYKHYREYSKFSFEKIGKMFGKSHASVLHALRNLSNDLETNYKPTVDAWERFNHLVFK